MCGIVGAAAQRDVSQLLVEGLRRLEYRGYDSAGVAIIDADNELCRVRSLGKVAALAAALGHEPLHGHTGIAHTRWATHGKPSEANAHPHMCEHTVALVHNGIIENHEQLRARQRELGFKFSSDTDTEVVVHQVYHYLQQGQCLLDAVRKVTADLEGAFALAIVSNREPGHLLVARSGSPLVIGLGANENFVASDTAALLHVTRDFIYLEEGDIADVSHDGVRVYDASGKQVERKQVHSDLRADASDKGGYRHFMLKEIFEQPRALAETIEGRISANKVLDGAFGPDAGAVFDATTNVHIVACGTSYHAGLIARFGFEELAGVSCSVEVASEFRYRRHVVPPGSMFVCISQSGETADTLAALRIAKQLGYAHTLAICNVPESSLVREADMVLMTRAGPEIGVASTKAFTTQLAALLMLIVAIGRRHQLTAESEETIVKQLAALPGKVEQVLALNERIETLAMRFSDKQHALFLGRGPMYPVAMEGALKLKELSYIHAEAYPAGELKHGPLALVDAEMPVIAVAPNNALLEKLKSNLQEVRARGGKLLVFADDAANMMADEDVEVVFVAPTEQAITPMIYTIPLQLLAYHVAVIKGTDVDQPRNLAKSVTVE